ncbi:flagellar hook-associated protein FlgL [Lutispora sp.]|uniref:flagellar hook-associated protein FlgL n=1 Tax=Lutispora sp. TaxID=2828727 RepID=UPI00356767A1
MRVTNGMMVNNMMRNITRNYSRMDKLQQQMATGKKFNRPSDDPIGVSRSLRLNTEVATMEQYKRNADDIGSWLSTTEMAISNINDVLKRAKELTVQAASETNSTNERIAIAGEIQELRNQLIQIGNTTYAGSYIFSGFKTDKPLLTSDGKYDLGGGKLTGDEVIEANIGMGDRMGMNSVGQRVFGYYDDVADIEADLNLSTADSLINRQSMKSKFLDPAAFPITATIDFEVSHVNHNGGIPEPISFTGTFNDITEIAAAMNTAIEGEIGPGLINVGYADNKLVLESDTGSFSIVTGSGLLGLEDGQESESRVDSDDKSQLIAVFDQLISDLKDGDSDGIRTAIERINTQSSNINAIWAEIGVKTNRVELTTNRILDDAINLTGLLSKNEDADMTEVIMNIKMEENVYRASLSTGARIIQPSLIDFLR